MHAYSQALRMQLRNTSVRVVELAPPGVETPLFRGEFAEETRGMKAMSPEVLAVRAMSRLAPQFALRQLAGPPA